MFYMPKQRIRVKPYADTIKVSPAQVRDWFHEGILPGIQIGKVILLDPDECDRALEKFHRPGRAAVAK
jgi:hypothetical protein